MLCLVAVKAQMSNTLYFMERIPQSQNLNPAIQPKCNVYFGFPGSSSFQMSVGNNSLSLSSILQKSPLNDSLIFFLNEDADKNLFFNDLKERNSFFFDYQQEILALGFRVKSWYFNAGLTIKSDVDLSYSKDLANFLIKGYKLGDQFNFENTGFNSVMYGELAFGASKIINEEWSVGAKVKVLNGFYNYTTRSEGFSFKSIDNADGTNQMVFDADVVFDSYNPFMESTPDTGELEAEDIFKIRDDPADGIKPFESMGLGFDLGATYSGFDKIVLSASIIDLGYISWKNKAQNYRMRLDNFTFDGLDIDIDSMSINADDIIDSLQNAITFSKTSNDYKTSLPTKFYIGGEYSPVRYFSVGLLSLTQYYRESFYQQVMLSANLRPLKMLMFSVSYSFFDNGFSNIGFGTSLRLGPTQFYFISDNIPFRWSSGIPVPYKAKYFSFRMGFNFVFGCNEKKKEKDMPLNY